MKIIYKHGEIDVDKVLEATGEFKLSIIPDKDIHRLMLKTEKHKGLKKEQMVCLFYSRDQEEVGKKKKMIVQAYCDGNTIVDLTDKPRMMKYWPHLLVQDENNGNVWLYASDEYKYDVESAKIFIEEGKKKYKVLTAWIDTFNADAERVTVYHECLVNIAGTMHNK